MSGKFTAPALQGGGALGAFELSIVKALYEQEGFAPDVVTGVPIGAISASVLVGAKAGPVEELAKLCDRLRIPGLPFTQKKLQFMMAMPCNQAMNILNLKPTTLLEAGWIKYQGQVSSSVGWISTYESNQ
ncbi:patatin-like phospholipase family protein [Marinobacterium sp. YM272]|uniref:patatin-like phospholipase family protein n=1 Tax=Marinobacterium sp. YM272 TaxID=3421654 RepID=UPI003D7F695A